MHTKALHSRQKLVGNIVFLVCVRQDGAKHARANKLIECTNLPKKPRQKGAWTTIHESLPTVTRLSFFSSVFRSINANLAKKTSIVRQRQGNERNELRHERLLQCSRAQRFSLEILKWFARNSSVPPYFTYTAVTEERLRCHIIILWQMRHNEKSPLRGFYSL